MNTFFSSHMFQTSFYLSLKISIVPYRVTISQLLVTNTKASLTMFALRKMTEPARKKQVSFSSMFKNAPNTSEASSSNSTPLSNNTLINYFDVFVFVFLILTQMGTWNITWPTLEARIWNKVWRIQHFASLSPINYNLGQNIWRLFHFLAQFLFTTSKTELQYYHQKVSVRVASRVAERSKTWILGN